MVLDDHWSNNPSINRTTVSWSVSRQSLSQTVHQSVPISLQVGVVKSINDPVTQSQLHWNTFHNIDILS